MLAFHDDIFVGCMTIRPFSLKEKDYLKNGNLSRPLKSASFVLRGLKSATWHQCRVSGVRPAAFIYHLLRGVIGAMHS
jgi:hypothetical protein